MLLDVTELYRFFHVGDDEIAALKGVSLHVEEGELVVLAGPSGSGKSTLLSCIAGLDEPDGGLVTIGGERMTRRSETARASLRARYLGVMMQAGNLFQHLTVAENLRLRVMLSGKRDEKMLASVLSGVGLVHRADSYPTQLSGGEAARAGFGVALVADPPLLIADEPTAEVDADTEALLIAWFRERRSTRGGTLIATHSDALAARADRIVRLKDGRIDHV